MIQQLKAGQYGGNLTLAQPPGQGLFWSALKSFVTWAPHPTLSSLLVLFTPATVRTVPHLTVQKGL